MGSRARFARKILKFFIKIEKIITRLYNVLTYKPRKRHFFKVFWKNSWIFFKFLFVLLETPLTYKPRERRFIRVFWKISPFFLSRTDGIRKSRCCQRGKILRQNKNSRTVFTARQGRYYVIFFLRVDLFLWQLWLFLMVDNRRKTFRQEYTFSFGFVVLA